ncbi:hypothetical protein VTO42DRAFT_8114 [Malbranchea cinnamomea]
MQAALVPTEIPMPSIFLSTWRGNRGEESPASGAGILPLLILCVMLYPCPSHIIRILFVNAQRLFQPQMRSFPHLAVRVVFDWFCGLRVAPGLTLISDDYWGDFVPAQHHEPQRNIKEKVATLAALLSRSVDTVWLYHFVHTGLFANQSLYTTSCRYFTGPAIKVSRCWTRERSPNCASDFQWLSLHSHKSTVCIKRVSVFPLRGEFSCSCHVPLECAFVSQSLANLCNYARLHIASCSPMWSQIGVACSTNYVTTNYVMYVELS